jgi:Uma2 family endonuclease
MSAETIPQALPAAQNQIATQDQDTGVRLRRWTRAEYHQAAALGWFNGERVELIRGELFLKMTQSSLHTLSLRAVAEALATAFGPGFDVRQQLPLVLAEDGEPEPDVLVVPGSWRDYREHPNQSQALLVVEISDTTLNYDRGEKASLYAEAGIADYWIVNLRNRTLEVYRQPGTLPGTSSGFGYKNVSIHTEQETVTSLAALQVSISIADLLPPLAAAPATE